MMWWYRIKEGKEVPGRVMPLIGAILRVSITPHLKLIWSHITATKVMYRNKSYRGNKSSAEDHKRSNKNYYYFEYQIGVIWIQNIVSPANQDAGIYVNRVLRRAMPPHCCELGRFTIWSYGTVWDVRFNRHAVCITQWRFGTFIRSWSFLLLKFRPGEIPLFKI